MSPSSLKEFDESPLHGFSRSRLNERNFRRSGGTAPPNRYSNAVVIMITRESSSSQESWKSVSGDGSFLGYAVREGVFEPAQCSYMHLADEPDGTPIWDFVNRDQNRWPGSSIVLEDPTEDRPGWFGELLFTGAALRLKKTLREARRSTILGGGAVQFWHTDHFGAGGHATIAPEALPRSDLRITGPCPQAWASQYPDYLTLGQGYPYYRLQDIVGTSSDDDRIMYRQLTGTPPSLLNLLSLTKSAVQINGAIETVRQRRLAEPDIDHRLLLMFCYYGPFSVAGDEPNGPFFLSWQHFLNFTTLLREAQSLDPEVWPWAVVEYYYGNQQTFYGNAGPRLTPMYLWGLHKALLTLFRAD